MTVREKGAMWLDRLAFVLILYFAVVSALSFVGGRNGLYGACGAVVLRHILRPFSLPDSWRERSVLLWGPLMYFGVIAMLDIFSLDREKSIMKVWNQFVLPFLPVLILPLVIRTRRQWEWAMAGGVFSMVVAASVILYKGFHGDYRAGAFHIMPHIFGLLTVIWVPAMVYMTQQYTRKSLWAIGYSGSVFLMSMALLVNGSRGAWVALALMLGGAIYFHGRTFFRKYPRRCMAGAAIFGVMVLAVFYLPPVTQRVLSIFDANFMSNWQRLLIWESSWHIFRDYFWTGIGTDMFPSVYNTSYISPLSVEREHPHAHQIFLQHGVESGIVGVAVFIWLLGILGWNHLRYARQGYGMDQAVVYGLIGFVIVGMTDYLWDQVVVMRLFWSLLVMAEIRRQWEETDGKKSGCWKD